MYPKILILGSFICLHVIPNLCDLLSSMTHKLILFNNVLAALFPYNEKNNVLSQSKFVIFHINPPKQTWLYKMCKETHKNQWCSLDEPFL